MIVRDEAMIVEGGKETGEVEVCIGVRCGRRRVFSFRSRVDECGGEGSSGDGTEDLRTVVFHC